MEDQCVAILQENSNSSTSASLSLSPKAVCSDLSESCTERSQDNGCIKEFANMRNDCQTTCLLCSRSHDRNQSSSIRSDREPLARIYNAQPQVILETDNVETVRNYTRRMDDYMYHDVYSSSTSSTNNNTAEQLDYSMQERINCKNQHELCTHWASRGGGKGKDDDESESECTLRPAYMRIHCAPACFSCHELDYNKRCPSPPFGQEPAFQHAGDLNRMFERIVSDEQYQQSELRILSQPKEDNDDGPWLVTIDKFLTVEECETLIELGKQRDYIRSPTLAHDEVADTNGTSHTNNVLLKDVVTNSRTSLTAWCDTVSCWNHSTTIQVMEKIHALTQNNIPTNNTEHLQLLYYQVGQYYQPHHDFIASHVARPPGPRILTVYMYLNDVENGGATHFTQLNVVRKCREMLYYASLLDMSSSKV
jgi:prolyl 4-hydroxylase